MIVWALEVFVTATIMMLLVLAVRKPVALLFGAEWAYALWLLPLFVPFLPPLPAFAPLAVPEMTVIIPAVAAAASPASDPASADWLLTLLALWGGGAIVFAIWQQSTYSAFMLHLGSEGREAVPPSFGGVRVVESEAVDGPVAVGIFRRRIVVPLDFASRYSPAERRLALEHELIHHKRFDLAWNWAALGMLTLNWFNPIAHFAFRAFRADQELACDAAVTRRAPSERHDYASALVKAASRPGLIAVCPLNHAEFLKRRLKMMKQHRWSRARSAGGLASVAVLTFAGLAVGAPSVAHQEPPLARIVRNVPGPEAAIAPAELTTLRDKCGGGASAIVCSREETKDPVVHAIVAKAISKAEARVEAAELTTEARAEAREAIAEARAEALAEADEASLEAIERVRERALEATERAAEAGQAPEARAHVRQAYARARTELGSVDKGPNRMMAVAHPVAAERVIWMRLKGPDRVEIEAAIAEAQNAIADVRLERELRLIGIEVERELKVSIH